MIENLVWILLLVQLGMFAAICGVSLQCRKSAERYIKLEEWTEDWLKRLEQKIEKVEVDADIADRKALGAQALCRDIIKDIDDIKELLPKDGKNELLRHNILLQQMNDEMEKSLQMEKEWNDGFASIMNYGKPITEVNKNE